jgi:hypothetical protein
MIYYAGIDPGQGGAIGIINGDGGFVRVEDWQDPLWPALMAAPFLWGEVKLAVIEKAHGIFIPSKPGKKSKANTSQTSFKYGENYGAWKMAFAALGVPYMEEATSKIRKAVLDSSVPQKPSKDDLRSYAIRRFPEAAQFLSRKKDDGRGEALIMALYARFIDRIEEAGRILDEKG